MSDSVRCDPEVVAWLAESAGRVSVQPMEISLKGFDQERFALWRVASRD